MAVIHVTWNKIYSVLILMFRTQLQLLEPFLRNAEKHIECMKSNRMLKFFIQNWVPSDQFKYLQYSLVCLFCGIFYGIYNEFNEALLKHHQIKFYTKKGGGEGVTDAYQRIYFNQIDVIHCRCFSELCRTGPRSSYNVLLIVISVQIKCI